MEVQENVLQTQLNLPASYKENLTPAVAEKIAALKATIDVHDKNKVISYGREEQAHLGKFADSVINGVATKDVGEAGEVLTKAIAEINGYNATCEGKGGLFSFLTKQKTKLKTLQTKYQSLSKNMDGIVKDMQEKDKALERVSREFDAMYEENKRTYEFLTMVIYAGEQALEDEKANLSAMQVEAEQSGDMAKIQEVSDYKDDIIRFERRLYDLKLSRTMAINRAPQIRNIQKSADEVSESIKTTIVNAIPLWKSQMADALGMKIVKEGANAVNAVKDATNALILANAKMNKEMTLEAAKAAERGIIDIETLNTVNQTLIDTFSGVYEIAQKAITDRAEGAKQLQKNEAELKEAIIKYSSL